jgi:Flp pilus assembly protein TadD
MRRIGFSLMLVLSLLGCGIRPHEPGPAELAARESKMRELLRTGNRLLQRGDWDSLDRAQAAYTVARELDGSDARPIDGLGCVAWRKGNVDLAQFYFQRAVELNPEYDRPVAHLALVAEAHGHLQAARELLARAVALNPLNFRARNNFAALSIKHSRNPQLLAEAYHQLLRASELAGDPLIEENIRRLEQQKGW